MSQALRAFGVAAGLLLGADSLIEATADPIADFYKGKTVVVVQAAEPGGAYDLYARFFGNHAAKHIPGNPTVVQQYMPGAGGVKAANYLYNAAPQDGTVIGMLEQGTPLDKVLRDDPTMKFDITKFNWIGTVGGDYWMIGVWHTAPATTIQGAREKEVLLGSSGKSSTTYIYPMLINAIGGTKLKPVTGYKGAPEMDLAMERGETHGRGGTWAAWKTRQRHNIEAGKIKFMLQVAARAHPEWPNVPRMIDLAANDEDRRMLEFMTVPTQVGRSLVAPPGVPQERVQALRRAFDAVMKDPEMLAEVKRAEVEVTGEPGVQLQALMVKLAATPPALVARVRKAIGSE
jgi:tripartite-type tricarboxylate transporter receptor subunit TctC